MLWSLPNANDPLPQASGRKGVLQYRNWFNWAVFGSASGEGSAKPVDGEARGALSSIGVESVLHSRTIGATITGLVVICILPIAIGFAVFYLSLLNPIAAPSMNADDIDARFAVIGIAALLLSAIAVAIAYTQSTQLASAVRSLAVPIEKFSHGEPSQFEASRFDEVNDVKRALDKAFSNQFEQNNKAGDDKRAAEQARVLKDEFIGTVSHELRTPLTSISASLSLLVASSEPGRAGLLEKLLPIALYNSQRLVRLVDDILDIEKLEAGKVKFHLQVLDIGALVERAIELNGPFADSMAVTLRYQWIEGSLALVDQDRILQVLSNLLSNAIKFSPSGSDVTVTVACREGVVRIAIRDSGPGIADEFKNRIFEKFSQADTSNGRCINGTGLGLSIVKGIVERLGGAVGWSDAPGGGSIFFVELPQHKRNLAGAGSVLVCLSDPEAASIICERLTREGFSADHVGTGSEALEKAAINSYSAVLVDLQLSDIDAISLIQLLRGMPLQSETPILAVSADAGQGRDDFRTSNLKVLDWLPRTSDAKTLRKELQKAIGRREGKPVRILHVNQDPDVLSVVADVLNADAILVSTMTVEDARRALKLQSFDLAVVDLRLDCEDTEELLPVLQDITGSAVPIIAFSAKLENPSLAAQVKDALIKSRGPLDELVASLRKSVNQQTGASGHE